MTDALTNGVEFFFSCTQRFRHVVLGLQTRKETCLSIFLCCGWGRELNEDLCRFAAYPSCHWSLNASWGWRLGASRKGTGDERTFFLKAWHLPKAQHICPAAMNGIKAVRSGIAVKYQMSKTHQFLFTCTVQKGAGVSFVGRRRQHMHNLTQLVWQELEMQVLIDLFLELQAVIVPWDGAVPFSFTC